MGTSFEGYQGAEHITPDLPPWSKFDLCSCAVAKTLEDLLLHCNSIYQVPGVNSSQCPYSFSLCDLMSTSSFWHGTIENNEAVEFNHFRKSITIDILKDELLCCCATG